MQITSDWDYGYRSDRIDQLIADAQSKGRKLTIDDMRAIQNDTRNGIAEILVPILLRVYDGGPSRDAFTSEAVDLLRGWDYTQPTDSAAAAYFNVVWAQILRLTFDELPEGFRPDGGDRWFEVVRTLMAKPTDLWWDDLTTPGVVENRDEVFRRAPQRRKAAAHQHPGQGSGPLAVGAAAPAAARADTAGDRRAGVRPAAGQQGALRGAGWVVDRQRVLVGRLDRDVRRHRGALDADDRRPGQPRPLALGEPERDLRASGGQSLRRPARRRGSTARTSRGRSAPTRCRTPRRRNRRSARSRPDAQGCRKNIQREGVTAPWTAMSWGSLGTGVAGSSTSSSWTSASTSTPWPRTCSARS